MRTLFMMAAMLFALSSTAQAETLPIVKDKIANSECSDCHMAYSPITLPQASWKKIFANLSDHFGEDASLDDATIKHVLNYYIMNSNDVLKAKYERVHEKNRIKAIKAGKNAKHVRPPGILRSVNKWSSKGAPERIQDVRRFKKKHSFSKACMPTVKNVMARAKIPTMAMCSGCHAGMPVNGSSGVKFKNDITLTPEEDRCLDD